MDRSVSLDTSPVHGSKASVHESAVTQADLQAGTGARPASLRRNFSWTLTGNVVYSACQWGMLTVLVKLGSAEMVGQFALAVAITTPVFAFANLQLRSIQATDARGDFRFRHYLGLRAITTALAIVVTVAIAVVGGFAPDLALVIGIAGVGRAFDAFSDVIHGYLQLHEDMAPIARSMMLNGVLSLAGMGVGVGWSGELVYGAIGSAVASGLTLLLYNLPVLGRRMRVGELHRSLPTLRQTWAGDAVARLAWIALPMGLVMLLLTLDTSVPRYVIERELGQGALGVFAALAYLIFAGTTVVLALGYTVSPRLARQFANGEYEEFKRTLLLLGGAGLAVGLAGAALSVTTGRPIVRLLYSEAFAEHIDTLTILALAGGVQFAASFAGFGMTAARRFRAQVPLYTVVVMASLVTSASLIPRYGLNGAAVSIAIAALVSLGGSVLVIGSAIRREQAAAAR